MTKGELLTRLPIEVEALVLRACTRRDIDHLAAWPAYPFPYEGFTLSFRGGDQTTLDDAHRRLALAKDRLTLVADTPDEVCIAYLALLDIDWDGRRVGNTSVRVHPGCCGQGIGTRILDAVCGWAPASGVRSLRIDVAASNERAIRCYVKSGFRQIGEEWRAAPDLLPADLADPRYEFLRKHARTAHGAPELRFLLLERLVID